MGTAGNNLVHDIDPAATAEGLDELHAYELVSALWCRAVVNRLVGVAHYLLEDELEEQAETALGYAQRLAERIAQLGGAITCDPAQLLTRSGVPSFVIPKNLGDPALLQEALEYQRRSIVAYDELWRTVDGKDAVTARLLLEILAEKVAREDEMESVLSSAAAGGG